MATTTRILDANVNGTVYTTNANSALEALDTCHSGAVAPTDEVANGKLWLDTSTTPGILKIYNNATWEVVVNTTNVTTAGALMDSELTSIASVKALNQGVSTTDSPSFAGITATGVDVTGTVTADGLTVDGAATITDTGNVVGSNAPLLIKSNNGVATTSYGWDNLTSSYDYAIKTNGSERMRIDSSGNVGINGSPTVYKFKVQASDSPNSYTQALLASSNTGTHYMVGFKRLDNSTVGSITHNSSTTAYNTTSDYRLKENITPIQGAADIVKAMQPVTYTFKSDGSWMDGFLAHELQELHPLAVIGEKDAMRDEEYEVTPAVYEDVVIPAVDAVVDEDGNVTQEAQPERTEQRLVSEAVMGTRSVPDYQGVDYSKLTPILTAALQEALNKIDALEARVAALEL